MTLAQARTRANDWRSQVKLDGAAASPFLLLGVQLPRRRGVGTRVVDPTSSSCQVATPAPSAVAACAAAKAPRLRGAVQDENLELQANLSSNRRMDNAAPQPAFWVVHRYRVCPLLVTLLVAHLA